MHYGDRIQQKNVEFPAVVIWKGRDPLRTWRDCLEMKWQVCVCHMSWAGNAGVAEEDQFKQPSVALAKSVALMPNRNIKLKPSLKLQARDSWIIAKQRDEYMERFFFFFFLLISGKRIYLCVKKPTLIKDELSLPFVKLLWTTQHTVYNNYRYAKIGFGIIAIIENQLCGGAV